MPDELGPMPRASDVLIKELVRLYPTNDYYVVVVAYRKADQTFAAEGSCLEIDSLLLEYLSSQPNKNEKADLFHIDAEGNRHAIKP